MSGWYWVPHRHGQWTWKYIGRTTISARTRTIGMTPNQQRGIAAGRATAPPNVLSVPAGAKSLSTSTTHSRDPIATTHSNMHALKHAGEAARWRQQLRDMFHVPSFPVKDWKICGTIIAFLAFTEFTLVAPMRTEQESDETFMLEVKQTPHDRVRHQLTRKPTVYEPPRR